MKATSKDCGVIHVPKNCTLCLIKPHVVTALRTGDVLSAISDAGFAVTAVMRFHLQVEMAEEFFKVYRKIHPQYSSMVQNICAGPLVAVLIEAGGQDDVVTSFREYCGPMNPELARILTPKSLRAMFGGNNILDNGVHCTDLPDDGYMECVYFFETLASL